jgi:beta-phosphoglucomutase-like phosphatase (HAD superfamily)
MKVAAFLFDYDGTLVNTERAWASAIVDLVNARGEKTCSEEILPNIVGRNWFDIDRWLRGKFPGIAAATIDENAAELRRMFAKYAADYKSLEIASSVRFLRRAAETAPCAVVTGSPRPDVEAGLRRLAVDGCVKLVLGAGEYDAGKPSPSGYLKAAEILGVDPARCVVIEDSGIGVASGVAAGMKVLALGRSSSVPQTFVGETWKVDDLSEIDFDREFT